MSHYTHLAAAPALDQAAFDAAVAKSDAAFSDSQARMRNTATTAVTVGIVGSLALLGLLGYGAYRLLKRA